MEKEQIVSEVVDTLQEADFEVSRVIPYGSYCFDIAARKKLLLMLKVLVNVDSIYPAQAEQLKRLCHLISAFPILVGDRTRTEKIGDDVVHERYDLPAVNIETLRMLVQTSSMPLIFGTKGGYYVRIDGDALRREREKRGLSLKQVAEKIGVSRESVYNYEHGGNATVETAMALVDELGADLVRPVEVLKHVTMNVPPERTPGDTLLGAVISELKRIGFGVYSTPRTPFDAMAKQSSDEILTAVFERYARLRQNVRVISSLSRVVDINTFMVSEDETRSEKLDGVPVFRREDLSTLENRRDLSAMMREKSED